MAMDKRKYNIIFTGLFLFVLGFVIYFISVPKSKPKNLAKSTKVAKNNYKQIAQVQNNVKNEKPKGLPLHFVYDVPDDYERVVPNYVGTKRFREDLDNFQIVCGSPNCDRQVLTSITVEIVNCKPHKNNITVLNGDVLFTKGSLKFLKPNVRVMGDLYIKDIDFLKIPNNFDVFGDIYVINSDGLTFMGKNFIDGNIFVKGKSSIRALPYDLKMTGQIFI